jgi:cytochrome P450
MRAKGASIGCASGHWLMGSTTDYFRAPHHFVANLARANGGLARFRIAHKRILATSSPEIAHHVLVTRRERWRRGAYFRKLQTMLGESLLSTEGAIWKRRHGAIQPLLRRSEMPSLAPIVRGAAIRMLERWEQKRRCGEPISAVEEAQAIALDVIAERLFSVGLDHAESERFSLLMQDAMLLLRERNTSLLAAPMWCPTPRNLRLADYRRQLDGYFAERIDARLGQGPSEYPDLLDELIIARDPATKEPLSRTALIDEVKTLFFAGLETTAPALFWTLFLLAGHPETAARLRKELDIVLGGRPPEWRDLPQLSYTAQIVQEALRLYPPVYNLARENAEADELGGHLIPANTMIIISVYGIHRSESWGEDAGSFRPERFAPGSDWPRRSFLPFASGEHVCVGNNFAMTELMIGLAMIGQKYRLTRCDAGPIETLASITLTPSRDILVNLEPNP